MADKPKSLARQSIGPTPYGIRYDAITKKPILFITQPKK